MLCLLILIIKFYKISEERHGNLIVKICVNLRCQRHLRHLRANLLYFSQSLNQSFHLSHTHRWEVGDS